MEFKQLTPQNINHIIDLYIQTFNQSPWYDHWQTWSVQKRLSQIANAPDFDGLMMYQNEQLIGFILGNQEQFYDGVNFVIKEFCVDPTCQGSGFGSRLLTEFEQYLKIKDIKQILLMTLRSPQTEGFYQKNGYTLANDLIMMNKVL